MSKLYILKGLPASGKSTFARDWVLEDPTKRVIVNRDAIRNMLGKYWVVERESLVSDIEKEAIFSGLYSGYDVMVDATNFNGHILSLLYLYKKEYETIEHEIIFFDTTLEICIERDRLRENPIGEVVIRNMHNKYLNNG